jgi:acetyltransferase-like isoleucine patch superfamily enzyme
MSQATPTQAPKSRNSSAGLQALLLLDIWFRTMIWAVALSVTLMVMSRANLARSLTWDALMSWSGAWHLATSLTNFILLFNVVYLLELIFAALPLPKPQRGVHRLEGSLNGQVVIACIRAVITKARFQPPFPGIFVGQLASIQPFRWLIGRSIGPRCQSSFFLDPNIIDPWGIKIGKNVTLGFGATITCHLQERDYVILDEVVIEDDVSIGAYSGIGCGVHIKRGAVVQPYSAVKPSTVIGEYELWGGLPARLKGTVRPAKTGEFREVEPSNAEAEHG